MIEKISEEELRKEKIRKVKEKILKEIEKYSKSLKNYMKTNLNENKNDNKIWRELIFEEFILLKLEEFIKDENTFNSYERKDSTQDIIVYVASDRTLNVWLQNDFSFVNRIFEICLNKNGIESIHQILNDRYCGYSLTEPIEYCLYEERLKKNK